MRSSATTVQEYLDSLPVDRRESIAAVRSVIRKNLPRGYVESMNWGGICYEIPLSKYPKTYNGQPLAYAGLASQKNYCAVYLMCAYQNSRDAKDLKAAFAKAGKKLDMGKCCIRFRSADDLPLDAIGKIVARTTPAAFIKRYEAARKR